MAGRINPDAVKRTIIFAVLILICAFSVYLYAHHNWNSLPAGTTIDRIVVEKSARRLSIFRDRNQIKIYRIALGRKTLGSKQEEGDMKTPEGDLQNRRPKSPKQFPSRAAHFLSIG